MRINSGNVPVLASLVMLLTAAAAGGQTPQSAAKPVQPAVQKPAPPAPGKPAPAPAKRWTDRGYLAFGGAYQAGSSSFTDTYTFDQYLEKASVKTEYPAKDGPGFDVNGGFRVWRQLAIGVGVTRASRSTSGAMSGTFPHPFAFNAARQATGSASLQRTETAVHLQAAWVIPAGRRMLVTIAGGPSLFSLAQSLVENASIQEAYPFDTATFASPTIKNASKSAMGVNAGLDVAFYFTPTIGVGGGVRFARAAFELPLRDGTISTNAGGPQVGIGLRVRLPAGKPRKAAATPGKTAAPPAKK